MSVLSPSNTPALVQWHPMSDAQPFAGHFPGRVLLPGAVLLDQILMHLQTTGLLPAHVASHALRVREVKFLSPVLPGDAVQLRAWQTGRWLRFAVQHAIHAQAICTGSLDLMPETGYAAS